MSQFYARYIPPAIHNPERSISDAAASTKRSTPAKNDPPSKKRKIDTSQHGDSVIAKYEVTNSQPRAVLNQVKFTASETEKDTKQRHKREHNNVAVNSSTNKHVKVLERFHKSEGSTVKTTEHQDLGKSLTLNGDVHPDRQQQLQGLEQLPKPAPNNTVDEPVIAYSTAPEWIANPLRVDSKTRQPFEQLNLGQQLTSNLVSRGKKEALPVQTAVLPLLVNKSLHERPDLCVAAATGSGKTFAYVLPIITALLQRKLVRLNAIIVVPTRALVKQVVHTIDQSSDGMKIKIGTAEGSNTLKEEQAQLVEERIVYDPTQYEKEQNAPVDWATFNPFTVMDELESDKEILKPGYVRRFFSKVDILICTPGRLVEHLQNTKGFNLDHVQWFVVDEADRLLNESYHEWLDLVLPALRAQPTYCRQQWIFNHMHMQIPERRVTKILLSATMMTDISQFMALELTNPKLVVVQNETNEHPTEILTQNNSYQLPPSLIENAIALKDSENKPLYLLDLIQKNIFEKEHAVDDESTRKPSDEEEEKQKIEDTASSTDSGSSVSSSSEDSDSEISTTSDDGSDDDDSDSVTSTLTASSSEKSNANIQQPSQQLTVRSARRPRILIFTKSTESTHRLARLLSLLDPTLSSTIQTFTRSSTTSKQSKATAQSRSKILQSFTSGTTHILISTDLAARGLDIPSLEHVINYDVPASALTYIHRVGRTARAGMTGHAWTLIEHKQGKWFWDTIGGKNKSSEIGRGTRGIQKVTVAVDMTAWQNRYEEALKKLGEDVRNQ